MTPEPHIEIDRVVIGAGGADLDLAAVADAVTAALRQAPGGAAIDPVAIGAAVGEAVAGAVRGQGGG